MRTHIPLLKRPAAGRVHPSGLIAPILTLMLAAGSGQALAGEDCKAKPDAQKVEASKARMADFMKKRWAKVDTNRDGLISRDEYLKEAADRFTATDFNHDGKLTPEEISQFFEKMSQPAKPADGKPDAAKP